LKDFLQFFYNLDSGQSGLKKMKCLIQIKKMKCLIQIKKNEVSDPNSFLHIWLYIYKEDNGPQWKKSANFYEMFKVHKKGKTPPQRPIISGSGSVTEISSLFVDHHIKNFATQHPSFLQDTPDFLRSLDGLNKEMLNKF
jgi:hypothetical protein